MSFEGAVAELEGAIQSDVVGDQPAPPSQPSEQAAAPTTPEGPTTPQVQPQYSRDELGRFAPQQQPQENQDTFDGGKFNPDTLPPELQDGWKQLQAAFTQKTQEVADQRRQLEQFGDLNEVATATQLYRALQDPQYLTQFHSELTQALQAQGLTPVQASAEAARQIESVQGNQNPTGDVSRLSEEFPELAPFIENQQRLEQRLASFEAQAQQRAEAEELAHMQMALAGELQRQEMAIRQANPNYKDTDIDAIYELSSFYDGNLLQAQNRYEQIVSGRIEQYLAGKSAAGANAGLTPPSGAALLSDQPQVPHTLDEGLKAALTHLGELGVTDIA